ncbi:hypothetical protein L204_103258 [Cryptococcus depauperatus]
MRGRKSGTFINVSSVAARDPLAACSVYAASKAALEVAPHNIRLLIVELGNFRTNFVSAVSFVLDPTPPSPLSASLWLPLERVSLTDQGMERELGHGAELAGGHGS